MKYYIYLLTYNNNIFYCGRTIDPDRRLQEHKRTPDNTLKYNKIRELNKANIKWELEVVDSCTNDTDNLEDFWLYKSIVAGHTMLNLTKGSVYTEVDKQLIKDKSYFATSEEFQAARELKKTKHKPISKKSYTDTTALEHMSDLASSKPPNNISPALQRIKDRRNKPK